MSFSHLIKLKEKHKVPKFRAKSFRRNFSCDLKDSKSKVKDVFDSFIFGPSSLKMPLTLEISSREIKSTSLVRFDYQIRAFLISREEFGKV